MRNGDPPVKLRKGLTLILLLSSVVLVCVVSRTPGLSKPSVDYSRFSHSSPVEHAALTGRHRCGSCHRPNNSFEPSFPKHRDCTGCHLVQFTASSSGGTNPICTICHNTEVLTSSNPALRKFPPLRSFTAQFDHAQHVQGIETARSPRGCVSCHSPRGVAQTIPSRLEAHRICYECHTPGKSASNSSSCGSCHGTGRYLPTSTNARAYRLSFSHANHVRIACQNCHIVKGRGLPQTKQVSSISAVEHFVNTGVPSCRTCHNGQRAFGDANTRDCKRCHKRDGFRMTS
jgi:c(7)-type cytochrome triheme protein